jgi:hypothetical protein
LSNPKALSSISVFPIAAEPEHVDGAGFGKHVNKPTGQQAGMQPHLRPSATDWRDVLWLDQFRRGARRMHVPVSSVPKERDPVPLTAG